MPSLCIEAEARIGCSFHILFALENLDDSGGSKYCMLRQIEKWFIFTFEVKRHIESSG